MPRISMSINKRQYEILCTSRISILFIKIVFPPKSCRHIKFHTPLLLLKEQAS